MSDAIACGRVAAAGLVGACHAADSGMRSHARDFELEAREPLASRLAKVAGVAGVHVALAALVLSIQPRSLSSLLPQALDVRTIVEAVKPPEPPKPKIVPTKPLPQAVKQTVQQPPPAPAVMTAAANADTPAPAFAVPPQPAPAPPAPPAPVAVEAPVAVTPPPPPPPPPAPVTAARFDADYLKNPPPAYPSASRRMREEGKVLLLVRVSTLGTAEHVQIRQSSGFPRLDEAALDAVRQWHFVPAKRGDAAIVASVVVPLVFRLD